jgi:hypothetical protein
MRLFTAAVMAALATIAWMSPPGLRTDDDETLDAGSEEDAATNDAGVEFDAGVPEPMPAPTPEPTDDAGGSPAEDAGGAEDAGEDT